MDSLIIVEMRHGLLRFVMLNISLSSVGDPLMILLVSSLFQLTLYMTWRFSILNLDFAVQ